MPQNYLRIPPLGTQSHGGSPGPRRLELTLPIADVNARRDHGVTEPEIRKKHILKEKFSTGTEKADSDNSSSVAV